MAVRTLVLRCPDWPVVAAGGAAGEPAAVLHANRVVAASPPARAHGVVPGLRRREAQARCPALEVLGHDPDRDARAFEPVARALQALTPRLELDVPGRCAFPTRGPSRYWGGDEALAARAAAVVAEVLGPRLAVCGPPGVGVADTVFGAGLAAERSAVQGAGPVVVARGAAAAFLAPFPVDAIGLEHAALADLCRRLGLRTLGQLAALPAADVLARFGPDGVVAHRRAGGRDDHPPRTRRPPEDLARTLVLDPPAERVEQVAFAARVLVEELAADLARRGMACTRLVIEAETAHGERSSRCWRQDGAFTPAAVVERVRWQLDGWLRGAALAGGDGDVTVTSGAAGGDGPTAGVSVLRLVPDEVGPDRGEQAGFWGGRTEADDRAARGLARVVALLGRDAVQVAEWRGGRGPADQLVLVPADTVDLGARAAGRASVVPAAAPPWPGRVPVPSPALVHTEPQHAEVIDEDGRPVRVGGRGGISAAPHRVVVQGRTHRVAAWAGPWLYDEGWWERGTHRRRARLQVVAADGSAWLLMVEGGRWWCEATYD